LIALLAVCAAAFYFSQSHLKLTDAYWERSNHLLADAYWE